MKTRNRKKQDDILWGIYALLYLEDDPTDFDRMVLGEYLQKMLKIIVGYKTEPNTSTNMVKNEIIYLIREKLEN